MMCEWGQGGREWRTPVWVWSLMDPSTDQVRAARYLSVEDGPRLKVVAVAGRFTRWAGAT